ncbi:MAG: 8-oxoguanine deaminase [Candidatus Bipolaricaulota bacterium]|nr:8-oxoguanine deaminase [Candidatus Bipolaricaulota bacterium]MDW8151826.1 8-oxoguanine deaminase [Candidatus Bipolaricaulota bacterium]
MRRILFRDVEVIATFDPQGRELRHAWLVVEGNRIAALGEGEPPKGDYDEVIDGRDRVMLPGMVNTHHHLYQTLFRAVPGAQDKKLFDWLLFLYERWRGIDEEAVYVSAVVGLCELLLSGCTTSTDHLYLFPRGKKHLIDVEIEAAKEVGIRFHPNRGSMSLSRQEGGLPPEDVVQTEEEILEDSERLILRYHDPRFGAMVRLALGPCSPFSVTPRLMRETAELARRYGVLLHTHLAETLDEEEFCLARFGKRPVEYLEEVGWLGPDVWIAHAVHLSDRDIEKLARAGVGVAHCPSSNMLLGSGIAPVPKMLAAGMKVGLAVDGSASNDASNMIREARQAMLLSRVRYGAEAMPARRALRLATLGGAQVMGWERELGSLEPGKCADLSLWDISTLEFAGAADPVAALLHCAAQYADLVMVNGEIRVRGGELVDARLYRYVSRQRAIAKKLVEGG